MAKKLYEEQNITDIANAIREKRGNTTKYKPADMANAIRAIEGSGGGGSRIVFSKLLNNENYMFANNVWNEHIPNIVFEGEGCISNGKYLFYSSNELEEIPNQLVFSPGVVLDRAFTACKKLKHLPNMRVIDNTKISLELDSAFSGCNSL